MSWSHCGTDRRGRHIGYAHTATCDHPDCKAAIDRGLDFACGGMHGTTELGCEEYFCPDHLANTVDDNGDFTQVCEACATSMLESGAWLMDTRDGVIVREPHEPEDQP